MATDALPIGPGLSTSVIEAPLAVSEPRGPDCGLMVLGGILGGVAGGIAGYYLGSTSDDLGTAYTSTALGTLVGIPVGVHVGNSARGNGPLTVLAGFGTGMATLLIATGGGEGSELVFAVPLTSALAAVWVEAKTMR
ncbi:hypothetical protein BH23GEM4_BH23GEM4_24780 [soil metagenome]